MPKRMGSTRSPSLRLRWSAAAGALTVLVAAAACIPDPEGDYNDFIDRTEGLRGATGEGDASIDSRPPEDAVEQLYVGICVSQLAARDPRQALRFYTISRYVPDGEAGKLSLDLTPMRGWDTAPGGSYVTPANVTESEKVGVTRNVVDAPVAAGTGRFTAVIPEVTLEPAANSVSGRYSVLERVTLDGRFTQDAFCARLSAELTQPYRAQLTADQNTCLFRKVAEGDPMPSIPYTEFVCPLN